MKSKNIKPILFSTEMVQAILAGRKTQTRRVMVDWDQHKPKYIISSQGMYADKYPNPSKYMAHFRYPGESTDTCGLVAPIQPGDILWVRETWVRLHEAYLQKLDPDPSSPHFFYWYKADGDPVHFEHYNESWKPSIFMPKEAARIFLKVTNVRVERLQDISQEDAKAEGIEVVGTEKEFIFYKNYQHEGDYHQVPTNSFKSLWDSINAKKHPWKSNPWVWVYTFEQTEKPETFL